MFVAIPQNNAKSEWNTSIYSTFKSYKRFSFQISLQKNFRSILWPSSGDWQPRSEVTDLAYMWRQNRVIHSWKFVSAPSLFSDGWFTLMYRASLTPLSKYLCSRSRILTSSNSTWWSQAPDSEPLLTPVFLSSTCFRPPGAGQQQSGFLNFTSGSVWKWRLQWRSSGSPMERSVAHGTLIDSPRYVSAWKQRKRR